MDRMTAQQQKRKSKTEESSRLGLRIPKTLHKALLQMRVDSGVSVNKIIINGARIEVDRMKAERKQQKGAA